MMQLKIKKEAVFSTAEAQQLAGFMLVAMYSIPKKRSMEKFFQPQEKHGGEPAAKPETAPGESRFRLRSGAGPADMWISPDPARQFHSLYATSGNPINNVDPDGLREYPADFIGPLLQEDWRAGDESGMLDAFAWIDANPDLVSIEESMLMAQATHKYFQDNPTFFGKYIHGKFASGLHGLGFYENDWNRAVNVAISPVYSDGTVREHWQGYGIVPNNSNYILLHNQDLRAVLPRVEYLTTSCFFCWERGGRWLVGAAYYSERMFGQNKGPMQHHVGK